MRTPAVIAVVDDDLAVCDMLTELFTDEGYQAVCFTNSASFFEGLVQHVPDLLLLDIHLEEPTSGWDILTKLRNCPATSALPIILSTADVYFVRQYLDQIQGLDVAVLDKPFLIETMLTMVRRMLLREPAVGC